MLAASHPSCLGFLIHPPTKPCLKPQVSPTIHWQYLAWSLWQLARVKHVNRYWGDKKKIEKKTLVRVNRLTWHERQGSLTSDSGPSSDLQHHCSVPVTKPLVRRPWADADPKLELSLPSSWHHWDGSHLLSGVSYQPWWRMWEALASCPATPQVWGWPGTKACRNATNTGAMLLAQDAKKPLEAPGREVQGLGSACDFVWY